MKKLIIILSLSVGLMPALSYAETIIPITTSALPPMSATACLNISRDVYVGVNRVVEKENVAMLQKFLSVTGYVTSDSVTGYFGPITRAAVLKFQKDNGISNTGYVGPLTRAKIKALSCAGQQKPRVELPFKDIRSTTTIPAPSISTTTKATSTPQKPYFVAVRTTIPSGQSEAVTFGKYPVNATKWTIKLDCTPLTKVYTTDGDCSTPIVLGTTTSPYPNLDYRTFTFINLSTTTEQRIAFTITASFYPDKIADIEHKVSFRILPGNGGPASSTVPMEPPLPPQPGSLLSIKAIPSHVLSGEEVEIVLSRATSSSIQSWKLSFDCPTGTSVNKPGDKINLCENPIVNTVSKDPNMTTILVPVIMHNTTSNFKTVNIEWRASANIDSLVVGGGEQVARTSVVVETRLMPLPDNNR